ncbi:hypothetical protein BCR43DRAFT_481171 [Syncephalastrum racemosum]|uniref:Uncharacterized protein n=1 Tax=Syncephalastrum racemosum TaxID=13706 RepID=A0A1X2HRI4_SYNRA|nr:hypothetical protein BCR43DRAFT_481171 [Syncephalastrum racemosum]
MSSSVSDELDVYDLPGEHLPGSDKLSKALLKNKIIVDAIANSLLDVPHGTYIADDSEWKDNSRSDVLLVPRLTIQRSLPPILIEVQHTVNKAFLRRVMRYSTHIIERYFCEPVVLIFCVDHVQPKALLGQFTKEDDGKPYLLSYQAADLWAKQCILIPKQIDLSFLTDDVQLDPVLALSLFFTEKQSCVARHTYAQDSTIRSLYMLAKRFVESERHIQENYIRTLNNICTTNEHQLMKMHDELDVLAPNISKLRKLVNRSIDYNRKLQQRYPINDHDDNSGSEIELPPQVSLTGPSTPSVPSDGSDGKLDDFMFITAFKQNYVKTMGRMDWRACFQAGRNENRFARYSTSASLRTQYDKYQAAQKRKSKRN